MADTFVADAAPTRSRGRASVQDHWVWLLSAVLLLYLGARVVLWYVAAGTLEDHDSSEYLRQAAAIRAEGLGGLARLGPDATPVMPLFTALFSLPGWPIETGARLLSLVASLALALAVWRIGRRLAPRAAVLYGLLVLALTPVLIRLGSSVLSEPSYIAIVYLGLWAFLAQYERPRLASAAGLGAIFSLAFLTRFEGVLFLAFLPFLQVVHWAMVGKRQYGFGRLAAWVGIYAVTFAAVAAPQVWRVSNDMHRFALNGRQVWTLISTQRDGRSPEEHLYSLDYSDRQINLYYLQEHPEAAAALKGEANVREYVTRVVWNFDDLYQHQLPTLMGPLLLAMVVLGILTLLRARMFFLVVALILFIAVGVVGPLLHVSVWQRHIAVIAPVLALLAGIGIHETVRELRGIVRPAWRPWVPAAVLLVLLAPFANSLRMAPRIFENRTYRPSLLREAAGEINQAAAAAELAHPLRIVSRRAYVPMATGGEFYPLPYTDLAGLIRYVQANNASFVYIETPDLLRPFGPDFGPGRAPPGFTTINEGSDGRGWWYGLYRTEGARPNTGH